MWLTHMLPKLSQDNKDKEFFFPQVKFVFLNVNLTLNHYAVQCIKYSMGIGMEELSRYEFTFF